MLVVGISCFLLVGGAAAASLIRIDPARPHQTIEGIGGALCFYNGWITAHPYKEEIYQHAFAGLNLSLLRLGNWFRYTNAPDTSAFEFVARAERILQRPVPVLMSSWAPPAFLKSNGQTGNGGTLAHRDGRFLYEEFAQYWYDALQFYRSNGVSPAWISIQNEPDWEADYDSCIFRPVEGYYRGTNYASYARALEAVHRRLSGLPDPPRLLAPEVVHIRWNTLASYAATLDPRTFYGVAYHLYGDSIDDTVDGYVSSLVEATRYFPDKPRFMTEYGLSNMLDAAILLHHCLTAGRVSGFAFWSLIWPGADGGLIQIEFPWDRSRWTNAPPGTPTQARGYWIAPAYWAVKHYSCFITPGSRRVEATSEHPQVLASAFLTPDNLRLVAVLINRHASTAATIRWNLGSFPAFRSSAYQTTSAQAHDPASTNRFVPLGEIGPEPALPPSSITTVIWDAYVPLGSAGDPSPAPGAVGVPTDLQLRWTPGSNALVSAVYLGADSNRVARAGPADPEFRGWSTTNALPIRGLDGGTTYFWRVDSIAGGNTNAGPVWSFVTAAAPALKHRYNFDEATGNTVIDSASGPAGNGILPNGALRTAGRVRLSPASQQHVALPTGLVSGLNDFSAAVWLRLHSAANWARIFDFGHNTQTNMFLTARNGSNGRLRFAITVSGSGGEQRMDGPVLATGLWYHIVVTLRGSVGMLYVNGAPVATNTGLTLRPSSLGPTVNNYLGRSQYAWDPYLDAELDEFQIYRVALRPQEIAALYRLGPDRLLAETPPLLEIRRLGNQLRITWPLAHAGFALQVATNLTRPDWQPVAVPSPAIVGDQWQVDLSLSPGPMRFYRLGR
ncbi:MAG: LamG-like jellyroll fold domain-containing protein [Limisphaera sp.]